MEKTDLPVMCCAADERMAYLKEQLEGTGISVLEDRGGYFVVYDEGTLSGFDHAMDAYERAYECLTNRKKTDAAVREARGPYGEHMFCVERNGQTERTFDHEDVAWEYAREECADAKKHDGGKPPLHLIPGYVLDHLTDLTPGRYAAICEVAYVLGDGAERYGEYNWTKGFRWSRLIGAAHRHYLKWLSDPDEPDAESGRSHLAHLGCELIFLIMHVVEGLGVDDRHHWYYKDPATSPTQRWFYWTDGSDNESSLFSFLSRVLDELDQELDR